jgi:hypothetical protein
MVFTLKNILKLILFLWVVFSVVYICNNIWTNYKNVQLVEAYNQGKADTINLLIQEAEKCDEIPVFSGDKEIQLIETSCLEE